MNPLNPPANEPVSMAGRIPPRHVSGRSRAFFTRIGSVIRIRSIPRSRQAASSRVRDIFIPDAGQPPDRLRNRNRRPNQRDERPAVGTAARIEPHRADLDGAVAVRLRPRPLRVEHAAA